MGATWPETFRAVGDGGLWGGFPGGDRPLISFDDGAMTFPEEDLLRQGQGRARGGAGAQHAGVWVVGDVRESQRASVVATDETVADGLCSETTQVLGAFA